MTEAVVLDVLLDHRVGKRDFKIFGHFLEHFHRQIYGGIYDPGNPLSDENGFRTDVIAALRQIRTPIIRWPGGCFVSAYHWKKGVGRRVPYYDKAWRVEESNAFGTDEFIAYCEAVGAEPYICGNAGTGTPQEMGDWVEYCNLQIGEWAALRRTNGHPQPFNVKYWSIGNENYGGWEMGAKTPDEWARYVKETAKMMKRVDPDVQLSVASVPDIDWNLQVLAEAGDLLDWISVHGYWSKVDENHNFESDYDTCLANVSSVEQRIQKTEHILGALGLLGKLRIAFDEWNLRGWCHPGFPGYGHVDHSLMNRNDINANYTMADAVFTASFLNACLRHCQTVGMANFSPVVNTVGAIFTHEEGIVRRPTYHVFDLYANQTYEDVVPSLLKSQAHEVVLDGRDRRHTPFLDAVVTSDRATDQLSVVLVNRHKDQTVPCQVRLLGGCGQAPLQVFTLEGPSADAFNDIDHPQSVTIEESTQFDDAKLDSFEFQCPAHSVSVLKMKRCH